MWSHVGKAHINSLKEFAQKKEFSEEKKNKHKGKFPSVVTAKCHCKIDKASCGCLTDAFIKGARINHFCVLQKCRSPKELSMLAECVHRSRDRHTWKGSNCGFQ